MVLFGVGGCVGPGPRGVTCWLVDGGEELTLSTPPQPENEIFSASAGELRLTAALNEILGVQLALRTNTPPAGPFDVRVSDLISISGRLPADRTWRLYRAQLTRIEQFRNWYPVHTGQPALPTLVPDVLVPWNAPRGGGPVVLTEPRNELVWLDLRVPPTATPGDYRGRLEVVATGDGTVVFQCEVRLEVLPVLLPSTRSLPVVCLIDPRDLLTRQLGWPRTSAEDTRILPELPLHEPARRLVDATMALFQEHRTNPVLWASFPRFRLLDERRVEVRWAEYDALVEGWLTGRAFEDRVPLDVWPVPASSAHPAAERFDGLDSPRYARVLSAYLAECERHFANRRWHARLLFRPLPPTVLSLETVARVRRFGGIQQQSETLLPLVAHLPARSLRGLGWHEAPAIDVEGVSIWAPPANWYEPEAVQAERNLGREGWLLPAWPPYSPTTEVGSVANDPRVLAWQAYRYGCEGIWLEHAAEFEGRSGPATALEPWRGGALVYPGADYGLRETPVPSVRLKRLRRGLQDYELLRLLEENGKPLLAQTLAGHVQRWAFTDACLDNLSTTRDSGWPRETWVLGLARRLMLAELAGTFTPDPATRQRQIQNLAQWSALMSRAEQVRVRIDGVRLHTQAGALRATALASVLNLTNRPWEARWTLSSAPPGWRITEELRTAVEPGGRRAVPIPLELTAFPYHVDGVYPCEFTLESAALGQLRVPARLAVATAQAVTDPPHIDGQLSDWPLGTSNTLGDFRLTRPSEPNSASRAARPTLPTQAFFAFDADHLYIAVRCALRPGEPPLWRADNRIELDGTTPWGQDVVEILLDPRGVATGTSGDVYCLQLKPSGLLLATRGCRTEPPMGRAEFWPTGARAAVAIERDAWIVELALPLEAFGPAGRRAQLWGANVTRLDARRGEYSTWSGTQGNVYSPATLGNLILPPP